MAGGQVTGHLIIRGSHWYMYSVTGCLSIYIYYFSVLLGGRLDSHFKILSMFYWLL